LPPKGTNIFVASGLTTWDDQEAVEGRRKVWWWNQKTKWLKVK